jgi:hypothetical protein
MWTLIGGAPQSADLDLTGEIAVWTGTPDAAEPRTCAGVILLGDGVKDLDGTGGGFTVRIDLGGQSGPVGTQVLPASARGCLPVPAFFVPAGVAVTVRLLSPNAADVDVGVTAYLAVEDASDVLAEIASLDSEVGTIDGMAGEILDEVRRLPKYQVATDRRDR